MTIDRRTFLAGASGATVTATLGAASVTFGLGSPAAAQGMAQTYMAPSRLTLFQGFILAAEARGYFTDEGLDITVQPGTGTAIAVQQVTAGATAFGLAGPSTTCPPIANQGAPLVSIGQIGYRNFWEIASLPDKPLTHPSEFQGKTIGIASVGGAIDKHLDLMSMAEGLDPSNVNKVVTGLGPSGYAFLERAEVDGFFVFYESKTALLEQGVELHYIAADDFAPLPSDALITSTDFAEDPANEEVIVKFLRACRRGVEAMQDPANYEDIIGYLATYNPIEGAEVEKGKKILDALKFYMTPPEGVAQMAFSEADWAKAIELLEVSGAIETPGTPPERFYTNRFISQV
ncbi:ABC transporter substrate-binding protein [bacterium]|nr:ABC transporter substrate-binding protein [bacterium]